MEADLYQDIFDAIQSHKNRISIPLYNECPIQKIVWSSFDYMAGPELRFVWEADYLDRNHSISQPSHGKSRGSSLLNPDCDKETTDGCTSSTDSSFSKNTGESATSTTRDQYEEIEAYTSELMQLSSEFYERVELESCWDMMDSSVARAFTSNTRSTLVRDADSSNNTSSSLTEQLATSSQSFGNLEPNLNAEIGLKPETEQSAEVATTTIVEDFSQKSVDLAEPETMVTSCVDSGIAGTVSIDSNLSGFTRNESKDQAYYTTTGESEECAIKVRRRSSTVNMPTKSIPNAQEVVEFETSYADEEERRSQRSEIFGRNTQCSLGNSQIDSQMFSSCSHSATRQEVSDNTDQEVLKLYRESELLATEVCAQDSAMGQTLSDESFVAKHVLAEQIGSTQLSSDPILQKFCVVPSRYIAFGSYIFSVKQSGQRGSMVDLSAFSIIFQLENSNWYLERQTVFKEIFEDAIARFKAAHLVEGLEDIICRCTREFISIFTLFGAIERWPLAGRELINVKIQSSHLWELRKLQKEERDFVARCITACLMCRGRCTVVGSTSNEVMRLLTTLSAFVDPNGRIFCLKPYKLQFSPYLRLQSIKRSEINSFYEQASAAHWSTALLDIDRKSVVYTGVYNKHRPQKMASQLVQISQIFREAAQSGAEVPLSILTALDHQFIGARKDLVLDTHIVRADPSVVELIDQIHLLPLNRRARLAFIDHFHLRLENRSKALICYVRDLSTPSPSDKRSALSSRWHLATVRRNLNMQLDSAFGIGLAVAENLEPGFAEFVAQQTTPAGTLFRK